MSKIILYLSVAIIAVILIVVSFMGLDTKTETWSSMLLGAAIGFLIVKSPTLIAYFKAKGKKA